MALSNTAVAPHTGIRENLRRVQQARRDVRDGKTRDDRGRNATDTKFTGEKPSAMLYLGVSMIALLKDLLDFVGVGSLPGIGFVVTACFSFLIWILLVVFDNSSKGTRHNMMLIRGLVVIAFAAIEGFAFGLNFLPIETMMVLVLYYLARKAWKKAKEEAEEKNKYMVKVDLSRRGQKRIKEKNEEMFGRFKNDSDNLTRRLEAQRDAMGERART